MSATFNATLAASYPSLSSKLQQAADYIVAHPVDTASRSLRSVARDSGVAPATFSRLAKALNYESFDALRDVIRDSIDRKIDSFSARVERLHAEHRNTGSDFVTAHMDACVSNIRTLGYEIDRAQLDATVTRLANSRNIMLFGVLGSAGVVDYMAYMASFLNDNWKVVGRGGGSIGSNLVRMDERDTLIVVTKPPFSPQVINAAKLARERGIYVIVISDTHTCEALSHASSGFIVPSNSPHFFSSYTATIFLVETIIGKLAAQQDASASQRIAVIEQLNHRLREACSENTQA